VGTELRHLRFEDIIVNPENTIMVVREETAKNEFRGRTIILDSSAKAAIERCMERARKLGASLPEHYIFPKRVVRGIWDPYKPASASWLRSSYDAVREAAGFPWLTPHCFRHMCITTLLENGVAPETVRHIAGHVSEKMMRRYSHNRHSAQMKALQAMDDKLNPQPRKKKSTAAGTQQQRFMARGRRRRVFRRDTA
jgi:integrase